MSENEQHTKNPTNDKILMCYFLVVVMLCLVAVAILLRAFNTAFIEKEKWEKVAESQKRENNVLPPARGNIYSTDGKLMATSAPRYYLYMDFKADCFTKPGPRYNSLDTFKSSKRNGLDSLAICLSRKLKDRTPAGYKAYLLRGLDRKSVV